jgi:hypothetical protein
VNLCKFANVFDAMATYVDAVEGEKLAAAESARRARVDKVASAHASAHGEAIPDDIRRKLAETDPSVLAFVENVLQKQSGVVEALGAPADPETNESRSVKQASNDAWARFGNFILS